MRVIDRGARLMIALLAPISALSLLIMMVLMVADVIGRYVFNQPIRGAYELTEFLMCIMVFGALPLVSLWRRHVEASLVADLLPRLAPTLHWLAGVASVLLFGYLSMLMWRYGDSLSRQNAQSLFSGIPRAPFAYYAAILSAITAVASAIAIVRKDDGPQEQG